jgi:hypothetical protein
MKSSLHSLLEFDKILDKTLSKVCCNNTGILIPEKPLCSKMNLSYF